MKADDGGLEAWLGRVRREYWERLADEEGEGAEDGVLHVVFTVGPRRFALEAGRCKGVVRAPAVSRLPLVPDHILGVAGIRGEIVSVTDPAVLLAVTGARRPGEGFFLLVAGGDAKTALWVDRVLDVVPVGLATVVPVDHPWPGVAHGWIRGEVPGDVPVYLLDPDRLVADSAVAGGPMTEGKGRSVGRFA